jgi:hypothetical protein
MTGDIMTYVHGNFCPVVVASILVSWGAQMNSLQQRLAAVTDTAANLKAQLCELNELRERVRKELLSARKSPQPKHRNGHGAISRFSLEIDCESAFGPH